MQNSASGQAVSGLDVGAGEGCAGTVRPGIGEVGPRKAVAIAVFHAPVLAAGIVGRVALATSAVGEFAAFLLLAAGAGGVGFGLWQLLLWALDRVDSRHDHESTAVG